MYRLVFEKLVTITELGSVVSADRCARLNAYLDQRDYIQNSMNKKTERVVQNAKIEDVFG